MVLLYLIISYLHKDRGGMQSIFKGALFQFSRKLQIFIQKETVNSERDEKWRPSLVCVSRDSFERDKAMRLLEWISNRYGFGTYIHLVEDYFSKAANQKSVEMQNRLMEMAGEDSNVYIDTLISPSYTSAIAQIIQLPGISGMPNNMLLFEYEKESKEGLKKIIENFGLARSADLDIAVLASTTRKVNFKHGIHVWIKPSDFENSNLMILISYIILGHPDWKKGKIKIFEIVPVGQAEEHRSKLLKTIQTGRLPISPGNIEIIESEADVNSKSIICKHSLDAGLTLIGFREEQLKHTPDIFDGYDELGDVLFINASQERTIE